MSVIRINQLQFAYGASDFRLHVERLEVQRGASVAITGPSGCGKTTLLNLISGVLSPRSGSITVDSQQVDSMSDRARRAMRISRIGMVFQEFELLDYQSVLDNVLLPYRISGVVRLNGDVRTRAKDLIDRMGLSDKTRRNVKRLSQGERQRVAICRALVTQPVLVLADEPTGNLDPANKMRVLDLLLEHAAEADITVVAVTHDHSLLSRFDQSIEFAQLNATPVVSGEGRP